MIYIESCIALAAIKKVNIKSNNTCGIRAKRIPRIPFHSYVRINKAQENPICTPFVKITKLIDGIPIKLVLIEKQRE